MPSWASEMVSFTPRRPRRARQQRSLSRTSRLPTRRRHAEHLAPAVAVHADRDGDRDRDDATGLTDLQIGGVDPDIRPVAFDRALNERLHADISQSQLTVFSRCPTFPSLSPDRRPNGSRCLTCTPPGRPVSALSETTRLQEGEKVAACPQLGDAQFNRAGPHFPIALVTFGKPVAALLAIFSTGQTTDL
jgi:hypothetical protein